jgi:hypothetical protein
LAALHRPQQAQATGEHQPDPGPGQGTQQLLVAVGVQRLQQPGRPVATDQEPPGLGLGGLVEVGAADRVARHHDLAARSCRGGGGGEDVGTARLIAATVPVPLRPGKPIWSLAGPAWSEVGEDVIPAYLIAHRRDDDAELVGYLVPQPGGTYLPVTVFGFALEAPGSWEQATRRLDEVGLSYLAEDWLLDVEDREEPIKVQIVEATPDQLTVKSVDYGYERDYGTLFRLDVPVQGQLRLA